MNDSSASDPEQSQPEPGTPPDPSRLGPLFRELCEIIGKLRSPTGCPWDRVQTLETIKPYTLEETYELLEAIDSKDDSAIVEELGDVLLQVVLDSQIAADEGRFDLHTESLHLEPMVIDVFETAVILGEEAGVTVSLPLVEDAVVLGDATRLRQLFLNLITNAIKYTPRGGHVEITLSSRNNGEVGFAVKDTGVGIAAADLPHLFDRFWRADRMRSRRPIGDGRGAADRGGFGLGLSIAQWIAQAHGGTLTAQSRLARGSTFTVLLPIAKPESEAAPVTDRLA